MENKKFDKEYEELEKINQETSQEFKDLEYYHNLIQHNLRNSLKIPVEKFNDEKNLVDIKKKENEKHENLLEKYINKIKKNLQFRI